MPVDMLAVQVNPQTFDRIMTVAEFVWPDLTLSELKRLYEGSLIASETFYFVPLYLGKYQKPDERRDAVLIREEYLKENFDFEMTDQDSTFTIVRKS